MTTKEVDNGPADESHPAWVKAYELAKAGKFTAALKLERSSLVNVQRASSGFTLLHQAAWHGASVAAEKLILLGARRDATDKEGKTAAAVARAQRHEKTAKRIESAGWWLVYEPAVGFLPSEQDGGFCRLAALTDKLLRPLPSSEVLETATASAWLERLRLLLADSQNTTAFEARRGPAPFSLSSVRGAARGALGVAVDALEAATAPELVRERTMASRALEAELVS